LSLTALTQTVISITVSHFINVLYKFTT